MKLAIFDLDGVLANTVEIHTKALRDAVWFILPGEAHQEDYLDAGDGIRTKDKLKRLAADYGLSDATVAGIDAVKKKFTITALSKLTLDKEIVKGIKSLRRKGYAIAIASNSRREFVDQVITAIGVRKVIDCSISGNEVTKPKPDPEIFLKVMEHFKVAPSDTYIFEDSPNGLEAAVLSGANVIVVNPATLVTADQFLLCK